MKMKFIIFALFLVFPLSSIVIAQPGKGMGNKDSAKKTMPLLERKRDTTKRMLPPGDRKMDSTKRMLPPGDRKIDTTKKNRPFGDRKLDSLRNPVSDSLREVRRAQMEEMRKLIKIKSDELKDSVKKGVMTDSIARKSLQEYIKSIRTKKNK